MKSVMKLSELDVDVILPSHGAKSFVVTTTESFKVMLENMSTK